MAVMGWRRLSLMRRVQLVVTLRLSGAGLLFQTHMHICRAGQSF